MEAQKRNNPTTRNLNPRKDLIGALGQMAVIHQIEDWGFCPDNVGFFDPRLHHDDADLEWRYEKLDVKTSPSYKGIAGPFTKLLIKRESMGKFVNRYIFVQVDIPGRLAYILGCMAYHDFWERYGQACMEPWVKLPCYFVEARMLTDFRKFVFAS